MKESGGMGWGGVGGDWQMRRYMQSRLSERPEFRTEEDAEFANTGALKLLVLEQVLCALSHPWKLFSRMMIFDPVE